MAFLWGGRGETRTNTTHRRRKKTTAFLDLAVRGRDSGGGMFLGMEDARWIRIPRHFCNLIKQFNVCSATDFFYKKTMVVTKRKCAKSECVSEGGGVH